MIVSIPSLLALTLCAAVSCVVGLSFPNKASTLPARDPWVDCFWSDGSPGLTWFFSLAVTSKCTIYSYVIKICVGILQLYIIEFMMYSSNVTDAIA